jgi:hypothetical protein
MKLTENEKMVIKKLEHPKYTLEYIDQNTIGGSVSVLYEAPLALRQAGIGGFMAAVDSLVKLLPEKKS